MRKILSLLIVYFLLINQVFAITGVPTVLHWEQAGFGGAGTYSMVVPDHFTANKVYAIPDVNAPYVSTNSGDSWSFLSYNAPSVSGFGPTQTGAFIQSKNTASLMYAMDSSTAGLYKSVNTGQSWSKVASYRGSKGFKTLALDPTDDNKVYVASIANGTSVQGGRVYASTDGAATWAELFRPFDTAIDNEAIELTGSTQTRTGRLNVLANILRGSVVFTSASGETFTDNGSGVLVSNMGGSGTINYSNPSDTSSSGSYGKYSLTFGSTPSTTTADYTVSYSATFIYVTSDGEDIFAGREASTGANLVKYNIAGETLTPYTLTGTNATYNTNFDTYVDGSAVENLCVTAGLKIACTANKGSSWTYTAAVTTGSTYRINHFAVRRKADTSINFVISRALISNIYSTVQQYSTDGGTTWNNCTVNRDSAMNPTNAYFAGTHRIFGIAADPHNETKFYMHSDWRIWRSTDTGATFNEEDTGALNTVAHDVKIAPNGRIFQANMDTGVQYSDDFGVTWTQAIPNATQPFVTGSTNDYGGHYWQIAIAGTQEEWDAGQGKIFITATMYSSPPSINYVNFLVRSLDSGATWSRSNSGLPTVALTGDAIWSQGYMRAIGLSADETKLYVAMDGQNGSSKGGLFLSTDDGATFTRVWTEPNRVFNALEVDPTDSTGQILMLGTFTYNLYRKTGASTSNYVGDSNGPTGDIVDVAYDSTGRPYAVGNSSGPVIWRSIVTSFGTGSGEYGTWRLMKRFGSGGQLDGIAIDPQNDNRIFVSVTESNSPSNRKIYVTTNADQHTNATWHDITGDFPVVGGCRALAVNYFEGTQGYLYCASNGANIWKINLADSPLSHPGRTCFGGCTND